jgi:hypothetical protein
MVEERMAHENQMGRGLINVVTRNTEWKYCNDILVRKYISQSFEVLYLSR